MLLSVHPVYHPWLTGLGGYDRRVTFIDPPPEDDQHTIVPAWPHAPATIVITDGTIVPQRCELYASHHCAILQAHHICPESWWRAAHKPVASPLIELCPNCHMNVHAAIDGLIHAPPRNVGALPPRCLALAVRALVLADEAGLTPAPTL